MHVLLIYWVLTLIILIILIIKTNNIGISTIITTIIIFTIYNIQQNTHIMYKNKDYYNNNDNNNNNYNNNNNNNNILINDNKKCINTLHFPKKKNIFNTNSNTEILNKSIINNINNPINYDTDDKFFQLSIINGNKEKKAKDIRLFINSNHNNYKNLLSSELNANSKWWDNNNEYELGGKNLII